MEKLRTILVADDNADLVDLVKCYFEQRNYRVLTALDGDEAIAQAKNSNPDLVLLDFAMPGKGGLDVLKEFMTTFGHYRFPFIILTGRSELKESFEEIEVEGFISKPFELDDLGRAVESFFQRVDKPQVFIVDKKDGSHMGELLSFLDHERYKAVVVEDFDEFKKMASICVPKFVLMEYLRGGVHGDEFIQKIKGFLEVQGGQATRILVYTYSGFDFKEKSLKAGADDFLGKPTERGVLGAMKKFEAVAVKTR